MNHWALPVGLITVIVLAFQNCAPPGPSTDQGTSSCPESNLRSFKTAAVNQPSVKISESRSELHRISSEGVLQIHIADLDPAYSVVPVQWNAAGRENYLVIARNQLVVIEARASELIEIDRITLDKKLCLQPFRKTSQGVTVGGYLIQSGSVHYVGCQSLSISSCTAGSGSSSGSGFGSRNSSQSGDKYSEVGSMQGGVGGSNSYNSGAGSTTGSQTGAGIGEDTNCSGIADGQTAWEYYSSEEYEDPSCRGYRVRYISITTEREVRCENGKRVPTGQTRTQKEVLGSC